MHTILGNYILVELMIKTMELIVQNAELILIPRYNGGINVKYSLQSVKIAELMFIPRYTQNL